MPTEGLDQSGQKKAFPRPLTACKEEERIEQITHITGDKTLNDILTQGVQSAAANWTSRVGNNGEISLCCKALGRSQRAHTTCLPQRDLAIGKHLANAKSKGRSLCHFVVTPLGRGRLSDKFRLT